MEGIPFNLLLFPLVGGYYIVTRLEWCKYVNQRLRVQEKVFNAIMVGIPLLIVSLAISGAITWLWPELVATIKEYFPVQNKFFGTCLLSFLLSYVGTNVLNKWINEADAIAGAIERTGSELERLFVQSCRKGLPIQITLTNGKVYVGWVQILPKPSSATVDYVKIIPLFSGYRDEKKELVITTDYVQVYAAYIKKGKIKAAVDLEMNLLIQISEILSAARFDFDIFEQFELNKRRSEAEHSVEVGDV